MMSVVVIKRLGQAMVTITLVNAHFTPFPCCGWILFEEWLRCYPSFQWKDCGSLLFHHALTHARFPLDWTAPRLADGAFGMTEIMVRDGLSFGDFFGLVAHARSFFKQLPNAFVLSDELAKIAPKEFLSGIDDCHKSISHRMGTPISTQSLLCDPQQMRDFMSGVSKRLLTYTTASAVSEDEESFLEEPPRRKLSRKMKSPRKSLGVMRDQTQIMLLGGRLNSLDESGRSLDFEETNDSYEAASMCMAKAIAEDDAEKARAMRLAQLNVFELAEKARAKEAAKPKRPIILPASFDMPVSNRVLPAAQPVDVSVFYEAMEGRMEAREIQALPTETERLREEVEVLAQVNAELEDRLLASEQRFKDCDAELREQKRMNDHLSEALSEKTSASAKELAVAAMLIADPDRCISAAEALQTAEVLSAGRLVVLPTARKSAADVPKTFMAGGKLLQLLLRLSQMWLPTFMESGDAVAKNVFSNNTYSATETKQLQDSKKLIQARTFNYRGHDLPMIRHLCIGVKRDTSKTLRVYFEVDREEGRVVVGWCGEHLPIACKAART